MLFAEDSKTTVVDPETCYSELLDGPRAPAAYQARRVIEMAVLRVFGVEKVKQRDEKRKRPRIILARQVSMYLAHTSCRMTLTDVGRLYERDRTTVAYACAIIEDRRDDPNFDRVLDLLEWAVPHMAARPITYLTGH